MSVLIRAPKWVLFFIAFLAGAINVLAFAPAGVWALQWLTLGLLFVLIFNAQNTKTAMLLTWFYCFAWLLFGVIWLTISMFRYGDMPVWLSVLVVALFVGALALIPALLVGCAVRYKATFSPAVFCLIILPLAWSVAEWTRGWIFTGFPWLVSGYAQNISPLAGFAPIVGVYGITWISAVIAGALVLISQRRWIFLSVPMSLLLVGYSLQFIAWTVPQGSAISVRLLQGNVDQNVKFEREHVIESLDFYYHSILSKPADLIVTPETALPLPIGSLPEGYVANLKQFSDQTNSAIILGAFSQDGVDLYANSALGISPNNANLYRYEKHHLVPFGEFIPKGFGWFYQFMHIPMGDQQRGALLAAPFGVKDQFVLPNICYEDVFGEEIAAKIKHAHSEQKPLPTILLNITNLAWFGDSWALPQHVQISQMRALETGRPMLRATNTGMTIYIDASGNIIDTLPAYTRGELDVTVQGYSGMTPYIWCGNYLWLGIMGALALLALVFGRAKKRDVTT